MAVCGRYSPPQPQSSHNETEWKDIKLINVLFVCSEWKSSKGGLSTFNREFATHLAKVSGEKCNIYCYVSESDEADREDARRNGVTLLTAQQLPGHPNSLDWLKIPPPELPNPDFVIGHGRKFGQPAYFIKHMTNCKWVQFVHVFCEDLGKYKKSKSSKPGSSADTIHENELKHEDEKELCKVADAVVAVGIGLQQKYRSCLPDTKVQVITPGIIDSFPVYRPPEWRLNPSENETFSIFVFGRAAREDLFVKGYDIANAVASLGEKFKLTFVGSPPGEQRKLEKWFLKKTNIKRHQLTIHSFVDKDKMIAKLKEANLFVLPSRTDAFGFVALEAMSAGVPVLIAYKTGIAEAVHKVENGDSVIVKSDDAGEWAKRIQQLCDQKPEQRHENAIRLRKSYMNTYCWATECKKFLALIESLHTDGDEREEPLANKENVNRQPKQASSNQSVSQGARKRRRDETDEPDFIPALLQATLWQYLGKIFGNCSESRGLRWGDISLYKHPKTGKERLNLKGTNQILEETENEALHSTTVKFLKMFQHHRPLKFNQPESPFYLAVKNKIKKGDPVWYMEKPKGIKKIGKLPEMKDVGSKHQRLS